MDQKRYVIVKRKVDLDDLMQAVGNKNSRVFKRVNSSVENTYVWPTVPKKRLSGVELNKEVNYKKLDKTTTLKVIPNFGRNVVK